LSRGIAASAITSFALAAGASFTAIGAYAQPPPPRDRPPPPPTGTAIIKGRVIDAQTGNALPRARVRLQAPGNRPPVLTDDTGAFKLTDVPAGPVSLFVDRSGYMTSRYPEAGKTIRANVRSVVTIADGQVLEGLSIPLYRGGVIVGRIFDAHGEPAEFVQIQILRLPPSGRGKPQMRGNSSTNDLGEFRAPRLEPGTYVIRAQSRNNAPPDDPSESQPVPTYYPGVLSIDQAQPIKVERGQTTSGIEIMLLDGVSSVVSGTVVDANGLPAPMGTYVNARVVGDFIDMMTSGGGTGVRPDGTFRFKLAPGEYQLEVQSMRPGVGGRPGPDDQQFGRLRVSVGSAPISDLTIALGPGATISGKLVFDGDSPLPPNADQITVGVGSLGNSSPCQSERTAALGPDGTFRVQGVVGTCVVRVMGNMGRWSVKSIMQGDVDLLDRPVTFEPGQQLRNVQVVLSDKRTELVLNVVDEHGLATREYVAIAFATDKAKWDDNSRYVRLYIPQPPLPARIPAPTRGSADLRAAPTERRDLIAGLPAGDYYVVALADIAAEDSRDPGMLERLAAGATRVSVTMDRSPLDVRLHRVELRD
jgi:hypothetical protein